MHEELTGTILRGFYGTYKTLGYGFLEHVYENALLIRLRQMGLTVDREFAIKVHFEGSVIGNYFADLVVNDLVLVEIKAAQVILKEHEAQLLNYLKATRYEAGLLLNFGPQPRHKRKVFQNERKGGLSWVG